MRFPEHECQFCREFVTNSPKNGDGIEAPWVGAGGMWGFGRQISCLSKGQHEDVPCVHKALGSSLQRWRPDGPSPDPGGPAILRFISP